MQENVISTTLLREGMRFTFRYVYEINLVQATYRQIILVEQKLTTVMYYVTLCKSNAYISSLG